MKENIRQLKQEINNIMQTEEIASLYEKPFHYLGDYWRDMDEEKDWIILSQTRGIWWLDEAGKWDYPGKRLQCEECYQYLSIVLEILKNNIKLLKLLNEVGKK
jgi:hypothetical protein